MPIPALIGALGAMGSAIGSQLLNRSNMSQQVEYAKDLMDYQWNNFQKPSTLVKEYAKAGISPQALVQGKASVGSPSVNMPSSAPVSLDGIGDIGSIAAYIQSVAQAKKAGMDTKLSEQDIKNKEVERQRAEFELNLRKEFGKDINTAELANSYMQLILASDASDINEQQKALNTWRIATEKALSQANEHQRDILKQNLDNNPTKISLENSLLEKQGSAAAAQAEAAHTQANVNREFRRINAALADVEESTKDDKILSLISEYQKNGWLNEADATEARLRASRLHTQENLRDRSKLWKAADDMFDWLKQKVSIFGK